ncbi:vegetative cell wall protein gp1-like [Triticum urartu]|uniref:vegetative cell wall protein gp1-like n=1 Tax=Triticum urartu TaxID=4572 RepID=UPI002044C1BB|nr:vegetative cell wall protein gp1-like [Triticum urartu]
MWPRHLTRASLLPRPSRLAAGPPQAAIVSSRSLPPTPRHCLASPDPATASSALPPARLRFPATALARRLRPTPPPRRQLRAAVTRPPRRPPPRHPAPPLRQDSRLRRLVLAGICPVGAPHLAPASDPARPDQIRPSPGPTSSPPAPSSPKSSPPTFSAAAGTAPSRIDPETLDQTPVAQTRLSLYNSVPVFCEGCKWRSVKCILAKLSCYLHQWKVLCDDGQATLLQRCILLLDKRRGELLRIAWR